MDAFSTAEIAAMRDAQEAAMQDEYQRLVWTEAVGFGTNPTYVAAAARPCGYKPTSRSEVETGNSQRATADAELRVPVTDTINRTDRVRITKRFGTALATPLEFDIIGIARQGVSGSVYLLKEVTL